jgi:hypothetical protein
MRPRIGLRVYHAWIREIARPLPFVDSSLNFRGPHEVRFVRRRGFLIRDRYIIIRTPDLMLRAVSAVGILAPEIASSGAKESENTPLREVLVASDMPALAGISSQQ